MADILAIVGSTHFACPDGYALVHDITAATLAERRPDKVISGGARGVDRIAVHIAEDCGIEVEEFLPRNQRWQPDGFRARNLRLAVRCTRLLRISCAESPTYGSGWTADRAAAHGKPVRRVTIHRDGTVVTT